MADTNDLYHVATYENGRFTGYLTDNDSTSWTLAEACRLAQEFTEQHQGTYVAICFAHN